jgi:ribosomal protein S18 acetylase RimI-like enzyme
MGVRRFRRAAASDVAAIRPAMAAFNVEEGIDVAADVVDGALRRLLDDPALGLVVLAERRGALDGYGVLTFGFDLEFGGRDAFVTELFVAPARRRAGLGRALLAHIEKEARAESVHALHLVVRPENRAARELYARTAFADSGRLLLTKRLP